MDDSRSGAGGKFIVSRRKQRLSRTPYDRPPPSPSPQQQLPPARSPNWFSGLIVPSARAVASGARRIISSVLHTESESSSEEDEDTAADNLANDQDYEINHDGVRNSNEVIDICVQQTETKRAIEQLMMQETFSREECDSLTKVLKSRVIDLSTITDRELNTSPWKMINNEDDDSYNKAVLEAKKWFQENKMGSSSVEKTSKSTCNVNPYELENVDNAVGSPVDVARSYMKGRSPRATSMKQIRLRTPLSTTEFFKEGTAYAVGHDPFSSSKKWSSVASGSWNIHEELRKVRSKATEEILKTPPSKFDPSVYATAANNHESDGVAKQVIGVGKRLTEPDSLKQAQVIGVLMDAGVSSDPAIAGSFSFLATLGSRQDGEASEARSSMLAAPISRDDEDSGAVKINGDCSKAEECHSGLISGKMSGLSANKVTEIGRKQIDNGILSSQVSTNQGQQFEGNHVRNENKSPSSTNLEGNCELLTEACVEVPIIIETDSIASGSQSSMSKQHDEFAEETTMPNTKTKADVMAREKQPTKSFENLRRSRRRGAK